MNFSIIDFLIGAFTMNAMPHLIFAVTKTHFISPFGYEPAGHIKWVCVNLALALILFHVRYNIRTLLNHGMLLGAGFIILCFVISGRFFYNLFSTMS